MLETNGLHKTSTHPESAAKTREILVQSQNIHKKMICPISESKNKRMPDQYKNNRPKNKLEIVPEPRGMEKT